MQPFIPLAGRARTLFHLQAFSRLLFFWLPVLTAAGAVAASTDFGVLPAALTALGLLFVRFLFAVWWPYLSWRAWGWFRRDDELLIKRGVLYRSVTAIPLERIQHVDVRQGPLEQWLGLARVHIHTASGVGPDGMVPGLLRADAEGLRDELVRAAGRGDDGV